MKLALRAGAKSSARDGIQQSKRQPGPRPLIVERAREAREDIGPKRRDEPGALMRHRIVGDGWGFSADRWPGVCDVGSVETNGEDTNWQDAKRIGREMATTTTVAEEYIGGGEEVRINAGAGLAGLGGAA